MIINTKYIAIYAMHMYRLASPIIPYTINNPLANKKNPASLKKLWGFNFKLSPESSSTMEIVIVVPNNAAPNIEPIAKLIPSFLSFLPAAAIATRTSGAPFLIVI